MKVSVAESHVDGFSHRIDIRVVKSGVALGYHVNVGMVFVKQLLVFAEFSLVFLFADLILPQLLVKGGHLFLIVIFRPSVHIPGKSLLLLRLLIDILEYDLYGHIRRVYPQEIVVVEFVAASEHRIQLERTACLKVERTQLEIKPPLLAASETARYSLDSYLHVFYILHLLVGALDGADIARLGVCQHPDTNCRKQ